ncbi:helix-turn-helix domain-containing protein [Neorhizobium petrolearium]|uniref:helix-turn-helix domain-containing protein n=1 Tax=Neorhizobium petrolearium TaxID=515361 RepID=UPI003F81C455
MQTLPEDERRAVARRADELVTAQNLRELRALAGRTQEDVSAATGVKQTNVSRLERRADET